MEALHCRTVHSYRATFNRAHTLLHSLLLTAWIYLRISSFPIPHNLLSSSSFLRIAVFSSDLLLSLLWLLNQAFFWRPVSRAVFPARLPDDDELPGLDVFICTADRRKEPVEEVMNTVLSAVALDYPPEKLTVYLSDDGGSPLTLKAFRDVWGFARSWVPFCRRYGIDNRCPEAYFSGFNGGCEGGGGREFAEEREELETKYKQFKEGLRRAGEDADSVTGQNHPPLIEVISDENVNANHHGHNDMPLLVYVSREKKLSHPHHFKAGALNVLLRVSSIISNGAYILTLDCDMYCNDPTSARQAMCFHLHHQLSPSLAFVQFPQKFHNVSNIDIYNAGIRSIFSVKWPGMDGLSGPMLSGTGFYIKRKALYATENKLKDANLLLLQEHFGPSNELIKSLTRGKPQTKLVQEAKILASCNYERNTEWGKQVGFLYMSVVEDYFTGFILHCNGWNSVYCNPSRPAFLGSCPTNLNDSLVQGTRWNCGLLQVTFSRFCPLVYGLLMRMSLLESMCYGFFALQPLYCFSAWCLAILPQLCLLHGIPLYPKVSSGWFIVLVLIFLSSLLKHLLDVVITGGTIQTWWNEWRIWMIKSVTCYSYGTLDAILNLVGMRKVSFVLTNKAKNDEQVKLYQMGKFDFRTSAMLLAPPVTLVSLNLASLAMGVAKLAISGGWEEMLGQVLLSIFILVVNYPIIEGMVIRKDEGRVAPYISLLSILFSLMILFLGSVALMF